MQNFKGFIFDLDGTAANTLGDLKTAMNEMLSQTGCGTYRFELLEAINYGARQFVQLSLPVDTAATMILSTGVLPNIPPAMTDIIWRLHTSIRVLRKPCRD